MNNLDHETTIALPKQPKSLNIKQEDLSWICVFGYFWHFMYVLNSFVSSTRLQFFPFISLFQSCTLNIKNERLKKESLNVIQNNRIMTVSQQCWNQYLFTSWQWYFSVCWTLFRRIVSYKYHKFDWCTECIHKHNILNIIITKTVEKVQILVCFNLPCTKESEQNPEKWFIKSGFCDLSRISACFFG